MSNKRKFLITILMIDIILACVLFGVGFFKQVTKDKTNEEMRLRAKEQTQNAINNANKKL